MSNRHPFPAALRYPVAALAALGMLQATGAGADELANYGANGRKSDSISRRHQASLPAQHWIDVFDEEGYLRVDLERDVYTELAAEQGIVLFGRMVTDETGTTDFYQFVQAEYESALDYIDASSVTLQTMPASDDDEPSGLTPPPGVWLLERLAGPHGRTVAPESPMARPQERGAPHSLPREALLGSRPGSVHVATFEAEGQSRGLLTCKNNAGKVSKGGSICYYWSGSNAAQGILLPRSGDPDLYIYERYWWQWWWSFEGFSANWGMQVDELLDYSDNFPGTVNFAIEVYGWESSDYHLEHCAQG